jgi:hypothetical protein
MVTLLNIYNLVSVHVFTIDLAYYFLIDHLKGNVEYIATVYHPEKAQYTSLLHDQE